MKDKLTYKDLMIAVEELRRQPQPVYFELEVGTGKVVGVRADGSRYFLTPPPKKGKLVK